MESNKTMGSHCAPIGTVVTFWVPNKFKGHEGERYLLKGKILENCYIAHGVTLETRTYMHDEGPMAYEEGTRVFAYYAKTYRPPGEIFEKRSCSLDVHPPSRGKSVYEKLFDVDRYWSASEKGWNEPTVPVLIETVEACSTLIGQDVSIDGCVLSDHSEHYSGVLAKNIVCLWPF